MKKKLRIVSLSMLIVAIIFLTILYFLMTSNIPVYSFSWMLTGVKTLCIIYPIIIIALFGLSFFVKDKK